MTISMNSEEQTVISLKYRLLFAVIGMVGAGIILLSTSRYGVGLSPDSVEYIAGARNIAAGEGFVKYNGAPIVLVPPLYPVLLAGIRWTFGVDPLSSARIINALLLGLAVYLSGLLCFRHLITSRLFSLLGLVAILVSKPLFEVSVMAWSEPLFIVFVLLFLLNVESYLRKRGVASIIVLALIGGLASLTRYIGVTLILTGMLVVLFFQKGALKTKIFHLFLFVLIPITLFGMWTIRNWVISGALIIPRTPPPYTLSENLAFTFKTVLCWYLPILEFRKLFIPYLSIGIGSLLFINFKDKLAAAKLFLPSLNHLILFIFIYTAFLILTSTTIHYISPIGNRYMSPVYVPITLLLLKLAENTIKRSRQQQLSYRSRNPLLIIGVSVWLLYPTSVYVYQTVKAVNQGVDEYSNKPWRESETIKYLHEHPLETGYVVYSNAADALYILADVIAKTSPAKGKYDIPERNSRVSMPSDYWPREERAYLVWFHNKKRAYLFTIEELRAATKMRTIAQFDDGAIYLISK